MAYKLLDLFCGAGGCAKGYHDAGFEVVGVDIEPQPHYPYEFIQADAMEVLQDIGFLAGFHVKHASPPCQAYTVMLANNPTAKASHPDLLPLTRKRLQKSGGIWVIENVPGAPVEHGVMLCGSMFGSKIRRHRYFETSHLIFSPGPCKHDYRAIQVVGHAGAKQNYTTQSAHTAMGINWMSKPELVQAIPPAYTRWIGDQFMGYLQAQQEVSA